MKNILSQWCGVLLISALSSQASLVYWDSNGASAGGSSSTTAAGTWGTSAFWSPSATGDQATAAWTAGDTAVFSAGTNVTGNYTVTLSGTQTAAGFIVEEGTVTFGGSGSVSVGAGTNNVINAGAVLITGNSARISATAGSKLILRGGECRSSNSGAAGSFLDSDMAISLEGGGTISHTAADVLNIMSGSTVISGTGPLTKSGAGIIAIATGCTYTGPTIINDGEVRIRTSANRLPTGTDVTVVRPGILNLNNVAGSGAVGQQIASLTGNGDVGLGASILVIGGSSNTVFNGAIKDTANAGGGAFPGTTATGGSVTRQGTGTITFAGTNAFTGQLALTSGGIIVAPTGFLCDPTCDVAVNGGTLTFSNAAQTIEDLYGTGGTIYLGPGHTLTVNAVNNSASRGTNFLGVIAGPGGIINSGNLTESFLGANTYTGPTTINAGKVVTTTASTGGGDFTVADGTALGARLASNGSTLNINNLTLGNSTMEYDFNTLAYPATRMTLATNVNANGTVTVDLKGFTVAGSATLMEYSGRTGGGQFVLGAVPPRLTGTLNDDTVNQKVTFSASGGDSLIWVGDASGIWDVNNSGNNVWKLAGSGGATYYQETTQGDVVHFDDSATGGTTVNLSGTVAPYQMTITNTAQNYVIGGSSGKISGMVAGLIKSGSGSVTLSSTNDFIGGTIWNGGALLLGNNSALGTGKLTLNGGSISSDGSTARTLSVAIAQNTDLSLGSSSLNGDLTFQTGAWTITGASRQISVDTINATINNTIGQDVTGRALTKLGSGVLSLGGANTFNGGFTHSAGTVRVNNNAALGAANSPVTLADGVTLATTSTTARTLTYGFSTLGNLTLGQAAGGTAALTLAGTLNLGGANRTITIDNPSDVISAVISNGGLIKDDANTLDLTGANTFTGGVQLKQGTLRVGNNAALGAANSAVTMESGVVLAANSSTARTLTYGFTLNGDVTLGQASSGTGALTLAGTMNLAGTGRTITVANSSDTISAAISNGSLTKAGTGTLVLSGANTYAGGTTVNEGTLQGTTSGLQGNIQNSTLVNFNQTTTGTFGGVISGNGAVTKSGSGAVTFSGVNDYTGPTTNSAGSLLINGSIASSTVQVNAGATLGGKGTISGAVNITGGSIAAGDNVVSNTVGILTLQNSLTLSSATNKWELAALKDDSDGTPGVDFDQIVLTNGFGFDAGANAVILLAFTNGVSAPDFAVPFWQVAHKWTVLQLTNGSFNAGGTAFAIAATNTYFAGTFSTAVEADGSISLNYAPSGPTASLIFSQPANQTVVQSSNATFKVGATGTAPVSYQWFFNSQPVSFGTADTLVITNAQPANEGSYYVVVTNNLGSATSSVVTLTVLIPPTFTLQPVSQAVEAGTPVTFTAGASGTAPLVYQWKFNGTNIAGATNTSYSIASVVATNVGNYSILVTNAAGFITSTNAALTIGVTAPPVLGGGITNSFFTLQWTSVAGRSYRAQYNADLSSTNWTDITPDVTAAGPMTAITNNVTGQTQRFYRVILLP